MVLVRSRAERLQTVRKLNLWGQDLCDASIVSRLPNLQVLSLSVNRVQSLKQFASCPSLEELYLRKNEIDDMSEVPYLSSLPRLRVLWLNDNPCANLKGYRKYVLS